MFDNAAMHTDLLLTAKQAETMAILVERDQVVIPTTFSTASQISLPTNAVA